MSNCISITSAVKELSRSSAIPLSTLKFNARALRDLGLIETGDGSCHKRPKLTDAGKFVLDLLAFGDSSKEDDENVR